MLDTLKRMARTTLRDRLGLDLVRVSNVNGASHFDDGWPEERDYWLGLMRERYLSEYGLALDPAQTDPAMVPPLETVLRIQNAHKADPDGYFATGYRTTLAYQEELTYWGASPADAERILDFGVGMGRLILHYFPFRAELHGCDVTPAAVEWTREKMGRRVRVELTAPEPPLPYPDAHFDFVYANSVFTHVPCELMGAWAGELRRVIRPGGALIFSVLDANHYLQGFTFRDFHRRFESQGCHVTNPDHGVHMLTYSNSEFLREVWGEHFRVLELRPHYRDQSHVVCGREG